MVTVAEVAVDIGLAHLDHSFDYLVPERLLPQAQVGCRVKVPFSGRARDGWILACKSQDKAQGLAKLTSVVSAEPLLTPEVQALLRRVADHYGGNLTDVIRLAIPTRHASTEKAEQRQWPAPKLELQPQVMPLVPGGKRLLELLAAGEHPRVSWVAPPVFDTAGDITGGVIEAAASTLAAGRGVIIVVPTARALARVLPRCKATFGARSVATLSAELGPSARYRNYLAISRGQARIVVGTRSAVYAPVADLGLIAVIDEGSDALWEKRAPHPHAREVAALRSNLAKCALLLAGYSRSAEAAVYVQRNWLVDLHLPPREARRLAAPVRVVDDSLQQRDVAAARVRLPAAAFRLLRDHLPQGPVLVQVPRTGFAAALACERCRERAVCRHCGAPLTSRVGLQPECRLCGDAPTRWECPYCHATKLRVPVVGVKRTAEELARAFPGVLAINSSGEQPRAEVDERSAIVVATPGAEPVAASGYSAALLLDCSLMLMRADVRVVEESMRRWNAAVALVRGAEHGGSVMAVGPQQHRALQALVRMDPVGLIERELAERAEAGLPPAVRAARIGGDPAAVADYLDNDEFDGIEVLGPRLAGFGEDTEAVALLRAPLSASRDLARAVKHASAVRSARKEGGRLYVELDPIQLE